MFQTTPVMSTAEHFTRSAYPFLTATITVGLLSMALIQVFKDLLPVRRWFQGYWVRQWLEQRRTLMGGRFEPCQVKKVEIDLVQLATDGDSKSFYDLPIEQLCGQLNAAAQAVLEHPGEHEALLRCLAAKASSEDVSKVLECSAMYREQSGTKLEGQDRSAFTNCVDARNRVAHQIQRAIDALQLSAGNRWKLWIQIFSIGLSGIIALAGVSFFGEVGGALKRMEITVAVAILGGFFAPVARDLIAGLQSVRK
jgi:hypothetical protein